jgi:hypothetical protein
MGLSQEEKIIQKRLSYVSGACFIASIFFPPAAIAGGMVLIGQAGRAYKERNSGGNEEQEKTKKLIPSYKKLENSFIPESPETAIARNSSELGKRTLEEISKNVLYSEIAKESEGAAEKYLNNLKELNPEKIKRSKGIKISFNQKENKGLSRIIFGAEKIGYELNVNLIDEDDG